ncbi:hypothetical protein ALC57_14650, partial [Trachymyrmex cornetzi]
YTPVSYSPTPTLTEPLDLTIPQILDPGVLEILDYSPPPFEERFLPSPSLLDQLPTPPSSFNQFPTPPPVHRDPQSADWDWIVQLFASTSNERDRLITVYVPGNSSPFLVQLRHLIPVCPWTSFLATNTQ